MARTEKQKAASSNENTEQTLLEANKKKKYKGVRMRSWGLWVSEIRPPNQKTKIWLGSHSTPEAAARAYDAASVCLRGSAATLNFPHSSYYIPDSVASPRSIQKIAAAAAESSSSEAIFGHVSSGNSSSSMLDYSYGFDGYIPSMAESWNAFDEMIVSEMYQENARDYSFIAADDYYDGGQVGLWSFNE